MGFRALRRHIHYRFAIGRVRIQKPRACGRVIARKQSNHLISLLEQRLEIVSLLRCLRRMISILVEILPEGGVKIARLLPGRFVLAALRVHSR